MDIINIELNMNNETIYMDIIDNECFYTDNESSIEKYSIKAIKRNMKLYKNYDLIKYLKDGASKEFETEFIESLKKNLNEDILLRLKWGISKISYEIDESEMIKRMNN